MGMVAQAPNPQNALHVTVDHDGRYAIGIQGNDLYALKAGIAAEVDGRWLHAADYPKHSIEHSSVTGFLGTATDWQVTCPGFERFPISAILSGLSKNFGSMRHSISSEPFIHLI